MLGQIKVLLKMLRVLKIGNDLGYYFRLLFAVVVGNTQIEDDRRILQGRSCSSYFLQGCLCKNWDVNFKKYM